MSECIGFEEGFKSAEEKLDYSLKYRSTPTISTENIISQIDNKYKKKQFLKCVYIIVFYFQLVWIYGTYFKRHRKEHHY